MIITVLRRYDINGAWTHEKEYIIALEPFTPDRDSMYRVHEVIDLEELRNQINELEMELEHIIEENRKLIIRIQELIKQNKNNGTKKV
jgi:hypothetical protein